MVAFLSICLNSETTQRISIKFGTGGLHQKLSHEFGCFFFQGDLKVVYMIVNVLKVISDVDIITVTS
jgi:hypothetical protein